jgi:hypothetical protein
VLSQDQEWSRFISTRADSMCFLLSDTPLAVVENWKNDRYRAPVSGLSPTRALE